MLRCELLLPSTTTCKMNCLAANTGARSYVPPSSLTSGNFSNNITVHCVARNLFPMYCLDGFKPRWEVAMHTHVHASHTLAPRRLRLVGVVQLQILSTVSVYAYIVATCA